MHQPPSGESRGICNQGKLSAQDFSTAILSGKPMHDGMETCQTVCKVGLLVCHTIKYFSWNIFTLRKMALFCMISMNCNTYTTVFVKL